MHAPDGLLDASVAIPTTILSAGCIGYALRQTKVELQSKQIPLAGVSAAFIFAIQMINFPVGVGTSGHIVGAALAAVLLGPYLGSLASVVVVVTQALLFGDGGITAVGYNVLNLAIVPAFAGYSLFLLFRKFLPASRSGVAISAGFAAAGSVVLAATSLSIQWLFGASLPIPFDTFFSVLVGSHFVVGVGEGVVTALIVSSVMASRNDIVFGARDIELSAEGVDDAGGQQNSRPSIIGLRVRTVALGGLLVSLVVATIVSQYVSSAPDSLEQVVDESGVTAGSDSSAFFADYATSGITNPSLSLALAGITGVLVTFATVMGMVLATRVLRRDSYPSLTDSSVVSR